MNLDMRIVELLCSKLCHDLVSPVGAINNGVELVNDVGGSVLDDAMQLIANSAEQASRKLRLFRVCYGRAGSDPGVGINDVRAVAEAYLSGGRVQIDWPSAHPAGLAEHRGALKVLLNMVMLAEECLPYGGMVRIETDSAGVQGSLLVSGKGVQLLETLSEALHGHVPIDEVTPRTVHAFVTGRFAAHYGLKINAKQIADDQLRLSLGQ